MGEATKNGQAPTTKQQKIEKIDTQTNTLTTQLQIGRILNAWKQACKYQKEPGQKTTKTEQTQTKIKKRNGENQPTNIYEYIEYRIVNKKTTYNDPPIPITWPIRGENKLQNLRATPRSQQQAKQNSTNMGK